MANITISELHITDSEIFLINVNDVDSIYGGEEYAFAQTFNLGMKIFEAAIAIFAINTIVWIAKSFNAK
ncbi:hypothetical protein [aff. Roholtiella sp. LEGE 12411]|uniref:hypothetical protein n=1 Tax=aff. Roholtiella sp. LEGE 12411 TaxID=1828822 RepID=UPI00187DDF28|nr:hypothetical protein [aff. Roholtiella sp. LEGE 12411]MBE9033554.1 hypothetical protein [aff. Roholtiella sp. LEGE 12411]